MRRFLLAALVGALFVACGLELGGPAITPFDSGVDVFAQMDASMDQVADNTIQDVTYDVPDFGMPEADTGIPCTCVGNIPNGWSPVTYNRITQSACPAYYDTQTNLVEAAGANPMCSCTCNGVASPPVCGGAIDFDYQFDSTNGCGGVKGAEKVDTSCTMVNTTQSPNGNGLNYLKLDNKQKPATSGGSCAVPTVVTSVPPVATTNSRQCKPTAPIGSCGMMNACMPNVSGDDKLCIMQTMNSPCPMNFPVRARAGTSYTDTRACPNPNTCNCTFTNQGACSTPKFYWYSDNNCMTALVNGQDTNGMCTQVSLGNSQTFLSGKYTSTNSNSTCGFNGAFNASGAVNLANGVTICCRP